MSENLRTACRADAALTAGLLCRWQGGHGAHFREWACRAFGCRRDNLRVVPCHGHNVIPAEAGSREPARHDQVVVAMAGVPFVVGRRFAPTVVPVQAAGGACGIRNAFLSVPTERGHRRETRSGGRSGSWLRRIAARSILRAGGFLGCPGSRTWPRFDQATVPR